MTVLIARCVLVGVFAFAAVGKLTDRAGVRAMVVEFGGPPWLAGALASVLIGAEASIALALAVGSSARIAALVALVLLVAFGTAVAITVGRGKRPECHCFGRLQATPVGWTTVARNGFLATLAGFVAAGGRFPLVFGAVAAAVVLTWLTLEVRRPGSLRRGSTAPALELADVAGAMRTLESLLVRGQSLLLVFGEPDCGACVELLPRLADWQDRLASQLTVALISAGSSQENRRIADQFGLRTQLADPERTTAAAYGVTATPTAILVDQQGRIAAGPAIGEDQIASLVERASASGPMLERRTVLARAAAAVATVTMAPLIDSMAAFGETLARVKRPKILHIDGAWLCDQRYALCTFASCQPSKANKHISVCRCRVKTGYSVGFKACHKRAPKGRRLHSNFSLQDVTKRTRALKCSEKGLWVQCLDVVCEVDPKDPKHAMCQCVNERTKNFYTFGGNCDVKTCKQVIWSATTAPFPGGAQYEKGLKRLGIPFRSPPPCQTSGKG